MKREMFGFRFDVWLFRKELFRLYEDMVIYILVVINLIFRLYKNKKGNVVDIFS